MKIKICGLTRERDVDLCVRLGATHLGFVIEPETPRCIDPARVRSLVDGLPRDVSPVLVLRSLLVVDPILASSTADVRCVQVHRFEESDAASLEDAGLRVHRAYDASETVPRVEARPDRLAVLDVGGGGSGRRFDWSSLAPRAPVHTFIAGGITPENLPELLPFEPWGIDVSSGVETEPGLKDEELLQRLFEIAGGSS